MNHIVLPCVPESPKIYIGKQEVTVSSGRKGGSVAVMKYRARTGDEFMFGCASG